MRQRALRGIVEITSPLWHSGKDHHDHSEDARE